MRVAICRVLQTEMSEGIICLSDPCVALGIRARRALICIIAAWNGCCRKRCNRRLVIDCLLRAQCPAGDTVTRDGDCNSSCGRPCVHSTDSIGAGTQDSTIT